MNTSPSLLRALERAYVAFQHYPLPITLDAAPSRNGFQILKNLSSAPLRSIPAEIIGPYASWAFTTVGSVKDYKHFLPRILEQSIHSHAWLGTLPEVIVSKLVLGEWLKWAPSERSAVIAVFREAMTTSSEEHPFEDDRSLPWLRGLALLGEDVMPHLWEIVDRNTTNAKFQIAMLVMNLSELNENDAGELGYWKDVSRSVRTEIELWATSQTVQEILTVAREENTEDQWYFVEALEHFNKLSAQIRHL